MSFKTCHYEIQTPADHDLVFCYAKQDIFLNDQLQLPTYKQIQQNLNADQYYCFAEIDHQRCLLPQNINAFKQQMNGFSPLFLKPLLSSLPKPLLNALLLGCHINQWQTTHRFCGGCGAAMQNANKERARECPQCQQLSYPRISPCAMVLITKGEKILLARSPHFLPDVYSVLAGFIEPGESVEQAIAREVYEEVGLQVSDIQYQQSQPWPFPDSLMLGFTAQHTAGDIKPDNIEIEDAQWFSRSELPKLPSKFSIARQLVEAWLKGSGHTLCVSGKC